MLLLAGVIISLLSWSKAGYAYSRLADVVIGMQKAGVDKPGNLSAWDNAPQLWWVFVLFLILPALFISLLITYLVYRGIKESRNFSNADGDFEIGYCCFNYHCMAGHWFFNGLTFNWTPPDDHGVKSFMPNGFGGVMMAVSRRFFAYIGFDAVSVLAEESKNPQRDLPRGMILSLVICTIVYILLTLVLTGAVNYRNFDGVGDPLAFIFEKAKPGYWLDAGSGIYLCSSSYDECIAGFSNGATPYVDEYEPGWIDASVFKKFIKNLKPLLLPPL